MNKRIIIITSMMLFLLVGIVNAFTITDDIPFNWSTNSNDYIGFFEGETNETDVIVESGMDFSGSDTFCKSSEVASNLFRTNNSYGKGVTFAIATNMSNLTLFYQARLTSLLGWGDEGDQHKLYYQGDTGNYEEILDIGSEGNHISTVYVNNSMQIQFWNFNGTGGNSSHYYNDSGLEFGSVRTTNTPQYFQTRLVSKNHICFDWIAIYNGTIPPSPQPLFNVSSTFRLKVNESTLEQFKLILNTTRGPTQVYTANLVLNGSIFESQKVTSLEHQNFSVTSIIPLILNNNTNMSHYWTFTNGSLFFNSTVVNQTVLWSYYPTGVNYKRRNVTEGEFVNVSFNFKDFQTLVSLSSFLTYESVNTTMKTYTDSADIIFSIPKISILNRSVGYNFSLAVSLNGTTFYRKLNDTSQFYHVHQISLSNCSISQFRTLDLIPKLESSNTNTTASINSFFNVYRDDNTIRRNFSFMSNNSDTTNVTNQICIYPPFANYSVNAKINYGKGGYLDRTYFLTESQFDNRSNKVFLYLLESSVGSNVIITVGDEDGDPITDAIVKILRFYPGTGTLSVVENRLTDFEGKTTAKLVLYDVFYKIIVEHNDKILFSSEPRVLTSTSLDINVQTKTYFTSVFKNIRGVDNSLTYNNVTQTFTFTYSSNSDVITRGCLEVIRRTVRAEYTICDQCVESVASSIFCTINQSQKGEFIAIGSLDFIGGSPDPVAFLSVLSTFGYKQFGLNGVFIAGLFIFVMGALGTFSPVVAILMSLFAFVMSTVTGFIPMPWGFTSVIIIVGFILVFQIKK